MALWELWPRVEAVVKHESYMSANDEFTKLKTAILKSGDLGAQAKYATVTWEFLLGFADKKTFYRSHVCQVVQVLLTEPSFRNAYASSPTFRAKAQQLHPDVRKALEAVDEELPKEVPKEAKVEKVKVSGKEVEWPDWGALEAAVRMEHYMGANEEFRLLRLAVLAADPLQLASQVGQAAMVWEFLVGFGEKKAHFRSQLGEVIGILRQESGWEESLDQMRPKLQARLQLLPEVLQKALGPDHSEAEEASNSASFSQENLEVLTEEAYCSPSFESLEDRLKSMMGCVADLAGPSVSPEESEAEKAAKRLAEVELQQKQESRKILAEAKRLAEAQVQQKQEAEKAAEAKRQAELELQRQQDIEKLLSETRSPVPAEPAPVANAPPYTTPLEKAQALLQKGESLEAQSPVPAYYLQVAALELLMKARQAGQSSPEADQLMLATLQTAENKKSQLNLTNGPQKTQDLILSDYERAVASDSLRDLRDVSVYLESLSQFYSAIPEVPQELRERTSYALRRADYLRACSQQGVHPEAPTPPRLQQPALPPPQSAPAPVAAPAPAPPAPAAPPPAAAAAPPPAAPAAKPPAAPAARAVVSPEVLAMPRGKRQSEARKKIDEATRSLKTGNEEQGKALIQEALGLLEGL
ncbi:unnamed protein product [Durusdinium trenchii]|uniref:CDP-diacylglycerol--inositol 3-phosphatidyltransferase n=2 Tax=Durusdinium trenchii TaxID=1381693 RepID=A0ABP0J4H2_9DINO